ncbi:MAG TPA: hypothetical protein VFC05_15245 [Nitrososphaeraceae archaeon]|nr:hypothetical protein [Nitrososphaeraceae archaeon]
MSYEVKDNSCDVCGEKPARASIYEYKKNKDPELPILHYSCLNHVLDLYNKREHKFVV